MTWPFENNTNGIVKNLVKRSLKADKRSKIFLFFTIALSVCMVFSIILISTGTQAVSYTHLNYSLANYRRKKLAKTGDRSKNGNLSYLTFDEAAFLAKVSRGMIYKWIDDGKFSSVKIGYISRVKRDEFEVWLKERERKGN